MYKKLLFYKDTTSWKYVNQSKQKIGTFINPIDWANGSGTLWFYAKTGTFQAETVNITGGGSFQIPGDLTIGAWKTMKTGALATRHQPKDELHVLKSPPPVSIGNAKFINIGWTATTSSAFPQTKNIVLLG